MSIKADATASISCLQQKDFAGPWRYPDTEPGFHPGGAPVIFLPGGCIKTAPAKTDPTHYHRFL